MRSDARTQGLACLLIAVSVGVAACGRGDSDGAACGNLQSSTITYGIPGDLTARSLQTAVAEFMAKELPRYGEPVPDFATDPDGTDRMSAEITETRAVISLSDPENPTWEFSVHAKAFGPVWRVGGYGGCSAFSDKFGADGQQRGGKEEKLETTGD